MNTDLKIGLLITTYNRPTYLKQCLNSLLSSDLTGVYKILIVDDGSTDEHTISLIHQAKKLLNAELLPREDNRGIHIALSNGFEILFQMYNCDIAINLDPDTLVKADWLDRLTQLYIQFPTVVISGFNTLSRHPGVATPRHDVLEWMDDYVTKRSIGGINMMFSYSTYYKIIKPCLIDRRWDWRVCEEFKRRHWVFPVTRPSVIQHIGLQEGMHMSNNPDVAFDF